MRTVNTYLDITNDGKLILDESDIHDRINTCRPMLEANDDDN